MLKKEVNEGNKLIVEFNDLTWKERVHSSWDNIEDYPPSYHKFWDYLMPVVEDIENIKIYSEVQESSFPIKFSFLRDSKGDLNIIIVSCSSINFNFIKVENSSKIKAVWLAVVKFIKWYNLCQKEK